MSITEDSYTNNDTGTNDNEIIAHYEKNVCFFSFTSHQQLRSYGVYGF